MEHTIIIDFKITHIVVNIIGFMVNISSINVNISCIMVNFNINCIKVIIINLNDDFMDRCVNIDFNGSINLKLNEHFHELTSDAINRCVRYP